jgi:hypothetical protein
MVCAKKQDLQQKCSSAWESYEAAALSAGFEIQTPSGTPMPPVNRRLVFEPVISLRCEHQKASRALSQHLSNHRC